MTEKSSPARDRILFQLKMRGPQTAAELAARLGITPIAVRQHAARLEADGLIRVADADDADTRPARGAGRPARRFALTEDARGRFPDTHGDLTVEILDAVRGAFGEAGLARVIGRRTQAQRREYRRQMPDPTAPLRERVAALAELRTREGYLAEWSPLADGTFELVENHCPICAAATACQRLCRDELTLFRQLLGTDVSVTRREHIPTGARRCVYEIRPRPSER